MKNFNEMGLPKHLLTRLANMGLETPTPIQAQAVPHAMEGRDVMGLAQTGTGKTFAFGLPLVSAMLEFDGRPNPKTVTGLVLAPTRELAKQISDALRELVEGTPLKVGLVVGGAGINGQINRLARGMDILVATPGRLLDLMDRRAIDLRETEFLVLDEADQMLDMGFIHDLRKIAALIPNERQTMCFSATMAKQMAEIAKTYLKDPVRVEVSPPGKAADKVTQVVHFIAKAEKANLLIELLGEHPDEAALVFGRTKHGSEKLKRQLEQAGFAAASIHGNKSQGQRDKALAAFKSGEIKVLVATDVAARGLDIPLVRHVYNYDLPNVPDNYVHRIGRTARAGADGAAVAFCAPDEMDEFRAIQKVMGIKIPVASGREWEKHEEVKPVRGGGGGQGRGRGRGGKPGGVQGKPRAGKLGQGKPAGGQRRRNRRRGGKSGSRAA
ncbi:DEAD/DEAH box helicase [Alisedimentitalea sp. MJ-SS2]|uniref:DEAD/DEAH box helicase n=1 Tax=Aliisedimentitalea sp. MJ-SS2 TaxID=3049795 RepID=UPI0029109A38|nr:DEAD/DEAH box helicase [Alisedimentitalea sp. MJ-SS2]MDU8925790.1 DEAD/DEAH box helicase [Alisedimentitalea sp. MJ-SS2]